MNFHGSQFSFVVDMQCLHVTQYLSTILKQMTPAK